LRSLYGGVPFRAIFQEGGGIKILMEDGRKVFFTEAQIAAAKEETHPQPVAHGRSIRRKSKGRVPMAYTIAQVRTAVLALLDDPTGARFTSTQIDQAARQALVDYDTARPVMKTYMYTADGTSLFVLPTDFAGNTTVTKIRNYDPDNPDRVAGCAFLAFRSDEQWLVDTPDETIPVDDILEITYSTHNTVDGLDAAAGTTIDDDNLFCAGTAGYAAQMRATSRAKSINMQSEVMIQLLTISSRFLAFFRQGLQQRRAEPNHAGWMMPEVQEVLRWHGRLIRFSKPCLIVASSSFISWLSTKSKKVEIGRKSPQSRSIRLAAGGSPLLCRIILLFWMLSPSVLT
jgi:hypothetical protein